MEVLKTKETKQKKIRIVLQIDKSTTIVIVFGPECRLQLSQTVVFVLKEIFSFLSPGVKFKFIYIFGQVEFQVIPIQYSRTEELKSRRTEERTEREKNDTFDVNAVAPYASDPVFGFGAGLGIHGGVGVVD